MAKKNPGEKATAFHEAGHAVAAYGLGIKLKKATIVPDLKNEYRGAVETVPPKRFRADYDMTTRKRTIIEKQVMMSFAGGIAAKKYTGRFNRFGAGEDHRQAVKLADCVTGSPEETEAYIKWLWIRTDTFVEVNWKIIELVAAELLAKKTLSYFEIESVIQGYYRSFSHTPLTEK